MKITYQQLKEVCKIGQGNECCRYLIVGPKGFGCAKHTDLRDCIDSRVDEGIMVARSDNCEGWGQGRNDRYEEVEA